MCWAQGEGVPDVGNEIVAAVLGPRGEALDVHGDVGDAPQAACRQGMHKCQVLSGGTVVGAQIERLHVGDAAGPHLLGPGGVADRALPRGRPADEEHHRLRERCGLEAGDRRTCRACVQSSTVAPADSAPTVWPAVTGCAPGLDARAVLAGAEQAPRMTPTADTPSVITATAAARVTTLTIATRRPG